MFKTNSPDKQTRKQQYRQTNTIILYVKQRSPIKPNYKITAQSNKSHNKTLL